MEQCFLHKWDCCYHCSAAASLSTMPAPCDEDVKALIRQYFEDNGAQKITTDQRSFLITKIKTNHPEAGYPANHRCTILLKGVKDNIAKAEAKVARSALPKVPFFTPLALKAIVAGILTAQLIDDTHQLPRTGVRGRDVAVPHQAGGLQVNHRARLR